MSYFKLFYDAVEWPAQISLVANVLCVEWLLANFAHTHPHCTLRKGYCFRFKDIRSSSIWYSKSFEMKHFRQFLSISIDSPIANVMQNDIIMILIRIRSNLHSETNDIKKGITMQMDVCLRIGSSSTLDSLSFSFVWSAYYYALPIHYSWFGASVCRSIFENAISVIPFSIPSNTFRIAYGAPGA